MTEVEMPREAPVAAASEVSRSDRARATARPRRPAGRPVFVSTESESFEHYRELRDRVEVALASEGPKAVLVSSAVDGEGKTTTLINLARAFAEPGSDRHVLVVDANVPNPTLHEVYGVSQQPGLGDVLAGEIPLDAAVKDTPETGVSLLPLGKPRVSLASRLSDLARFVNDARSRFGLVLIDASSVQSHVAAEVFAPQCEGVVLVARADRTPRDKVRAAKDRLMAAGGKVLGVVLHDCARHLPRSLERMLRV